MPYLLSDQLLQGVVNILGTLQYTTVRGVMDEILSLKPVQKPPVPPSPVDPAVPVTPDAKS